MGSFYSATLCGAWMVCPLATFVVLPSGLGTGPADGKYPCCCSAWNAAFGVPRQSPRVARQ
eukprot:3309020-Alexandrium_andersonii.AAC.1